MSRPPPYGREFVEARRKGAHVNPWLFAGRDCWKLAARRGPGRLVLPAGEDPKDYDWSCIRGEHLVVRWPDASVREVDTLGALLVRSGARSVLVLDDARPDLDGRRYRVLRPFRRYVGSRA